MTENIIMTHLEYKMNNAIYKRRFLFLKHRPSFKDFLVNNYLSSSKMDVVCPKDVNIMDLLTIIQFAHQNQVELTVHAYDPTSELIPDGFDPKNPDMSLDIYDTMEVM